MLYYESDVRDTVMILYVICQLVCVIDPWAHMSFVHSILSLKLGVTVAIKGKGTVLFAYKNKEHCLLTKYG